MRKEHGFFTMINIDMLKHLQKAPDKQLDPSMKDKLNNITGLSDLETVEAVFDVLHSSVHFSLASNLMIISLKSILKIWCDQCKYKYDEMEEQSATRLKTKIKE